MRATLAMLALLVALALGGCGGSDEPAAGGGGAAATTGAPAGGGGTRATTEQVVLEDGRHLVLIKTVDPGQRTVTFDLIQFYQGEQAAIEAAKDRQESPPPNDVRPDDGSQPNALLNASWRTSPNQKTGIDRPSRSGSTPRKRSRRPIAVPPVSRVSTAPNASASRPPLMAPAPPPITSHCNGPALRSKSRSSPASSASRLGWTASPVTGVPSRSSAMPPNALMRNMLIASDQPVTER